MENTYIILTQVRDLCDSGKYSQALSLINKAIIQDPKWPVLHRAKTKILFKMDKYYEAIISISSICEILPNDPKNWILKGYVILFNKKNPSDDEIDVAREALIEARNNIKTGNNWIWDTLNVCTEKLFSYTHLSSDKNIGIPPPPPPKLCQECGEIKNDKYYFCLNCGYKFE